MSDAGVTGSAEDLLRAHVLRRADHQAGGRRAAFARGSGDPEVRDPNRPVRIEEDVGGLDVPVDDPVIVGHLKGGRGLAADPEHPAEREPPVPGDLRLQVGPVDELHDDVVRAGGRVDAAVVDRDDPRVVEAGGVARLALEAAHERGVGREGAPQDLDRDLPVEELVPGSMDDRHPTLADLLDQAIAVGDQGPRRDHDQIRGAGRVRASGLRPVRHRGEVAFPNQPVGAIRQARPDEPSMSAT